MANDAKKDFRSTERPEKEGRYEIVSGYKSMATIVPIDMDNWRRLRTNDPIAAKEQAIDALKQMQPIPQQIDNSMTAEEIDRQLRYATPQFWISTSHLTETQVRYVKELLRRFGVGESTSDMEQIDFKVDGTFVYNEDGLSDAMEALDSNRDNVDKMDKLTEVSPDDMIRQNLNMENNSDG